MRHRERLSPVPYVFNHVIVEYAIDGQRRYVDPTISRQGGNALERMGVPFGTGLAIDPAAEALESIKPFGAEDSTYSVEESFTLDTAKLNVALLVLTMATGADADDLRRLVATEGGQALAKQREHYYSQVFPNVTRIHDIEFVDDRENNQFAFAETYRLENPFRKNINPKRCEFPYRSHLMQGALSLPPAKGERESPLALRRPGKINHRIEFNTSSAKGGDGGPLKVNSEAFDYFLDVRKRPGRWSWHYTLQMKVDSVEARNFDHYKRAVEKLWPSTSVTLTLPLRVSANTTRVSTPAEILAGCRWTPKRRPVRPENAAAGDTGAILIRPRGVRNPVPALDPVSQPALASNGVAGDEAAQKEASITVRPRGVPQSGDAQ